MASRRKSDRVADFPRFFALAEIADRLGVCVRTVERARAAGSFPGAVFLGRTWRIPAPDVERWLAGLRASPPPSVPG